MGHSYLHVNVFHPLARLVGQSEWLSVCISEREAAVTDCDIQSSGRASPFAFIRLFASHVSSVGKREGKRQERVFSCVCVCACDILSVDRCIHTPVLCSKHENHPTSSSLIIQPRSLNLVPSALPWRRSDGWFQGFLFFFLTATSVPHTRAGTHLPHGECGYVFQCISVQRRSVSSLTHVALPRLSAMY